MKLNKKITRNHTWDFLTKFQKSLSNLHLKASDNSSSKQSDFTILGWRSLCLHVQCQEQILEVARNFLFVLYAWPKINTKIPIWKKLRNQKLLISHNLLHLHLNPKLNRSRIFNSGLLSKLSSSLD